MKKIKTFNKLLSSLTLLSPLSGVGFNNQYESTQTVITENNKSLNNYFSSNSQVVMGDITVTVDGTRITGYDSGEGKLVVNSEITEIAASSFGDRPITGLDLTKATSLTTIGQSAFMSTTKALSGELFIPQKLSSIGPDAFLGNSFDSIRVDKKNKNFVLASNVGPNGYILINGNKSELTDDSVIIKDLTLGDLVFPSTMTKIADNMFENCRTIRTINFSNATNLTTIGQSAFNSCLNISSIILSPYITTIKESAFQESYANNKETFKLDLSNATNLTDIANRAFYQSSVKYYDYDLTIPSKVKSIGQEALSGLNIDKIFFLSEAAPTFGSQWCGIDYTLPPTKVYVPTEQAKNTYLSQQNFGFSSNNTIVGLRNKMGDLEVICSDTVISEYYSGNGKLKVNESITEIASNLFQNNFNVKSLDLSQATSLTKIGSNAFQSCSNLSGDIIIPEKVTQINSWCFNGTKINNIIFLSETPPTFGENWKPVISGKVYVPSEQAKENYLNSSYFNYTNDWIKIGRPSSKTSVALTLGLLIGLGIPVILAIAFVVWYLIKKKKTTVKI